MSKAPAQKAKTVQVRLDAEVFERLNSYIAKQWDKTKKRPLSQDIASAAVGEWLAKRGS